jgi:antirestriction protein ArdC
MKNTTTVAETPMPNGAGRGTDLYQQVTNKIIALIEKGVVPWQRTWSPYGLARNFATGHIYTGINLILMNNTGHPIPYFMTFNQVKERGGQIRKGAKAEMVIYFSVFFKDDAEELLSKEQATRRSKQGEEIQVLKFIKYYSVFNVADIEGIEYEIKEVELKPNERIEQCENIISHMPQRPELRCINGNQPFYSPIEDFVNMPAIEQFENAEAYYATLFHELVHSTGHKSRIGRAEVMNPQIFGSNPYSREEIVAEMGASFLCSNAEIDYEGIIENSASYLSGWLKVLKEDSRFIFKAAAEAQKAADYILGWRSTDVE